MTAYRKLQISRSIKESLNAKGWKNLVQKSNTLLKCTLSKPVYAKTYNLMAKRK